MQYKKRAFIYLLSAFNYSDVISLQHELGGICYFVYCMLHDNVKGLSISFIFFYEKKKKVLIQELLQYDAMFYIIILLHSPSIKMPSNAILMPKHPQGLVFLACLMFLALAISGPSVRSIYILTHLWLPYTIGGQTCWCGFSYRRMYCSTQYAWTQHHRHWTIVASDSRYRISLNGNGIITFYWTLSWLIWH